MSRGIWIPGLMPANLPDNTADEPGIASDPLILGGIGLALVTFAVKRRFNGHAAALRYTCVFMERFARRASAGRHTGPHPPNGFAIADRTGH